jgi:predicted GNAT superfamily acetyltransferase
MFVRIALWLLLLCPAARPAGQAKDEATLLQLEHRWAQVVEQQDPAALGSILADEFEEADFDGSVIDRAAMLVSAAKPSHVHCDFSEMHARLYGDFAYVRGIGVCSSNAGQPPLKNRFTDIFVYRQGAGSV